MKVHILQHAFDVPPGSVIEWAHARAYTVDIRHLYRGDELPSASEIEFLVICGGPMNVDDTDRFTWLLNEKALLRELLLLGTPMVGLCLGGQLLAQCLGGEVRRHKQKEIGWHDVEFNGESSLTPAGGPRRLRVFQWHQDTFTIPPGARRIAGNRITENQAFEFVSGGLRGDGRAGAPVAGGGSAGGLRGDGGDGAPVAGSGSAGGLRGDGGDGAPVAGSGSAGAAPGGGRRANVIGFQFHPETTEAWLELNAKTRPFPCGPFVQSPKQMLDGAVALPRLKRWFFSVLDALALNERLP